MEGSSSPVVPVARRGVSVLEEALLSVRELPAVVDRGAVVEKLEHALSAGRALAESELDHVDHLGRLDDAIARCQDLAALLERGATEEGKLGALRRRVVDVGHALRARRNETIDAVVAAQDRALKSGQARERSRPPPPPFRASVGLPALYDLRSPTTSAVDVTSEEEDPIDDSEGDESELAPPAPAPALPEATLSPLARARDDQLRAAARDGLGDIASLSTLRRPLDKQPWTVAEPFEQRLLDVLDFVISLEADGLVNTTPREGPEFILMDRVYEFAGEVGVADPGRAFTRAFILGCLRGGEAAAAAVIGLRQAKPELHAALCDALCLGSNPNIGPALVELLSSGDAAQLRVALQILRFRRHCDFAATAPLLAHPDATVATEAAKSLVVVEQREAAREALRAVLGQSDDGPLDVEAARSLMRMGDVAGLRFVRERLRLRREDDLLLEVETADDYTMLLALGGNASDLEALEKSLQQTPISALAAGWFGHPALVESWLLPSLAAGNWARDGSPWVFPAELAMTRALHRITGESPAQPPRVHAVRSDGYELAVDHATWATRWNDVKDQLPTQAKTRFGKLYTPMATLEELEDQTFHGDRRVAIQELDMVSVEVADLELGDWTARQLIEISALREKQEAQRYEPGSWPELQRNPTA